MDRIPKFVTGALAALGLARILVGLFGYRLVWLGGDAVFLCLAILFIIGAIWLRAHAHWRHFTLDQTNLHCTFTILLLSVINLFLNISIMDGEISFFLPLATLLLITTAIGLLLRTGNVAAGLGSLAATWLVMTICFVGTLVYIFKTHDTYTSLPVSSPDGNYTAQVVLADDSYIALTKSRRLHLGILTLEPIPKKIHIDHASRDLSWEDATTVRVGESLYKVR